MPKIDQMRDILLQLREMHMIANFGPNKKVDNVFLKFLYRVHSYSMVKMTMNVGYERNDRISKFYTYAIFGLSFTLATLFAIEAIKRYLTDGK